jgi:integral membrane protein
MGTLKQHLRLSALLEGTSFLILLLIAMPLKYFAGIPEYVTYIGWAHGVLFMWYIIAVSVALFQFKFTFIQTAIAFTGSILPLGTFYADHKIFKHL